MVNIAEIISVFLDVFFAPISLITSLFIYCESFLRTLTVGIIFVLSLGKILSKGRRPFFKYIKWFIYVYYLSFTLYSLGVFTNLLTLNWLDWATFVFSICAPISLVVLGKIISNAKLKGYKIFTYIVIMLIYLIIGWLWFVFAPKTINFTIFLIVWIITLFLIGAITIVLHFNGGDEVQYAKK